MSLFDLILILILAGFALFGLWFGLIHTLGSLLGTLLGVYLASRVYLPMADWLMRVTGWSPNFSKVLMFIIAFLIINRLVGLAFFLVDRALSIITRLPFLSGINRLLGAVFGFLEGMVVAGTILLFITKFPLGQRFMDAFAHSSVAPYCTKTALLVWPLVPEAIQALKSAVF